MKILNRVLTFFIFVFLNSCSGGYSFTGGDIGDAKTAAVKRFDNLAPLVNPKLSQEFTEKLQELLVRQTPLTLVNTNEDLSFSGEIVDYQVKSEAPGANDQIAQSRLSITVKIRFKNFLDAKKDFDQNFSGYRNFPASSDLSAVEDVLVDEIVFELVEKIFNRALVNW